jgi:hypothetical protein
MYLRPNLLSTLAIRDAFGRAVSGDPKNRVIRQNMFTLFDDLGIAA